MQFATLQECLDYIEFLTSKGREIPQSVLDEKARLERLENVVQSEYIFGTMAAHNKFMTPEKDKVVREMVDQLFIPNATQPCLLLGKVQCGKTDTFLSIMGLCFDRGIDIAIVMTKGTRTLTTQTIKRLNKEFRFFKDQHTYDNSPIISIWDVLDLGHKGGLSDYQLNDPRNKFIIVCKKEDTNLKLLNQLFDNDLMKSKKVLICDDEADFASRAYYQRRGEISLLHMAEHIEALIAKIPFYRYLQITATPYSLYLQPDGTIQLRNGAEATQWLPRYTGLVPIHNKYVGGKQYFELSEDPESMYSCLWQEVSEECLDALSTRNEWFLESSAHSETLNGLNLAIVSYLFSAAVRSIQERKIANKKYYSSCLIHCEIAKANHKWQEDLITKVIEDIKHAFINRANADLHILEMESTAYESLHKSNDLAKNDGLIIYFPSFAEVEAEVKHILEYNDYTVNVVNSEEPVATMIVNEEGNEQDGQLRLERTLNFFIGGSILDRGITIANMLCFFYGRDPKKFQMDTVLQHARMYGARSKEDMACTRFFTTSAIYDVLKSINNIDCAMYDYLKNHRDSVCTNEFTSMVIGYDTRISASARNKYTPANTQVLRPRQRILPRGFQTGEAAEIAPIIAKIDALIQSCPGFATRTNADPFFEIDYQLASDIIELINSTYHYSPEWENMDVQWDTNDMQTALDHCLYDTDGKLYCLYRPNRFMSRERDTTLTSNAKWSDAPDDGHNDTKPSRDKAVDRPVLILTRQEGRAQEGWRDTPFYWPILILPQNMDAGIYTLNGLKKFRAPKKQHKIDFSPIDPAEVLQLTLKREHLFWMLHGDKKVENRLIKRTTCSLYLQKDEFGNFIKVEGTDPDKYYGLTSFNGGLFPYEIRQYKYIYFRTSQDYSGSQAIFKLKSEKPYELEAGEFIQEDIVYDASNKGKHIENEDACSWWLHYQIGDLIKKQLTDEDEQLYDEFVQAIEDGIISYN